MSAELSDLDIVKACALAMDYVTRDDPKERCLFAWVDGSPSAEFVYWPLTDKAQSMDLVIALELDILRDGSGQGIHWDVSSDNNEVGAIENDLLRAICLCAARIQLAKELK